MLEVTTTQIIIELICLFGIYALFLYEYSRRRSAERYIYITETQDKKIEYNEFRKHF